MTLEQTLLSALQNCCFAEVLLFFIFFTNVVDTSTFFCSFAFDRVQKFTTSVSLYRTTLYGVFSFLDSERYLTLILLYPIF